MNEAVDAEDPLGELAERDRGPRLQVRSVKTTGMQVRPGRGESAMPEAGVSREDAGDARLQNLVSRR